MMIPDFSDTTPYKLEKRHQSTWFETHTTEILIHSPVKITNVALIQ
jgi:hypothetical protein